MDDKLKQAYQDKAEADIRELQARIELLKAKAGTVQADVKVEFNERISELREQQEELQSRLQSLREAGEGAWQELQSGVDKALADLREAVEGAFSRFQLEPK